MPPTTQQFGWKDRDTAARDLLQLVYHAPESISLRALELLQAIRSPAVVPELLDIFRDEGRSNWVRIYALRVVSHTPIDICLPELRTYLRIDEPISDSGIQEEILFFVSRHTSNQTWLADYQKEVIDYILGLPIDTQIKQLREFDFAYRGLEQFQSTLFDLALRLIDARPELLDLDTVQWLRYDDPRESTRQWLDAHLPRLVELCLTIDTKAKPQELVYFLEHSEALREATFQTAPALLPQYEAPKVQIDAERARRNFRVVLNYSAIWNELASLYKRAQTVDQAALERLKARTNSKDILEQAAAVHFFGKLSDTPHYLRTMLHLLQYPRRRYWQSPSSGSYVPVIFEAGEALREQTSAQVWEALITTFFKGISNECDEFFIDWIAYQTDRLSGVEVEYTGTTWDVEHRPWFRALLERESQAE